jgi:DNA-binding NarL/FixJ family response regulator
MSEGANSAGKPIRVLLADDHAMVRTGLRMIVEDEEDMVVVGDAEDGAEALRLAEEAQPAVLLADLHMPAPDGIELARLLREVSPQVRTIIVSAHEDTEIMREALAAGAVGYVVKRLGPTVLIDAIRAAADGKVYAAGTPG